MEKQENIVQNVKDGLVLKTENTKEIIETIEEIEEKQKRKYSPNYMLQNYKTLIKNLNETGMLDEEDKKQLNELGKKMIRKFISIEMFE